jgi:hypothetical protein
VPVARVTVVNVVAVGLARVEYWICFVEFDQTIPTRLELPLSACVLFIARDGLWLSVKSERAHADALIVPIFTPLLNVNVPFAVENVARTNLTVQTPASDLQAAAIPISVSV